MKKRANLLNVSIFNTKKTVAASGFAGYIVANNGVKFADMTKPIQNQQPSSTTSYPEKTTGSETAARVRKEANNWSERTRSQLFDEGMQIIYGGNGSGTAKVRS
jgi:hypothetical protein